MTPTPEQAAREWWNAHWTSSDGAAIATLTALLATREAAVSERCASIADMDGNSEDDTAIRIAAAIRAMGRET